MSWEGGLGLGGGPIISMKDSLFLLISNVLGRGCGAGRGPSKMMKDSVYEISAGLPLKTD